MGEQEATYGRKLLTEMTREELIEAVKLLGNLYNEQLETSIHNLQFLRELRSR